MADEIQSLPLAPDRENWGFVERSELGVHGACDLVHRVSVWTEAGPSLPEEQARVLPMLLHEFDRQPGLAETLAAWGAGASSGNGHRGPSPKGVLTRILPRMLTYRYVEQKSAREFVFEAHRPSSIHVLARVLETDFKFRLEDLSHFATHGELLLKVLDRVGLHSVLDAESILYCPALDFPFPFKFSIVGQSEQKNRETYLALLKQLLRKTESDEEFRARNHRELTRGFQKFGPASATPQFQEVELRLWRCLSYLAARLRVKAGRMSDTRNDEEVPAFLSELRHVHHALEDLVHLPGRLAAFYRTRFDLELGGMYAQALEEIDAIARRIDCDFSTMDRSIEVVAEAVSAMRRLGSASPLEGLEEQDVEVKRAYGDVEVTPLETGWVRTYDEKIFTKAKRFDTRRFSVVAASGSDILDEKEFELDVSLDFGLNEDDEADNDEADEDELDEDELDEDELDEGELGTGDSAEDWDLSDMDLEFG